MNPDPIVPIFNFCDRWCARCAFTAHCAAFVSPGKEYSTATKTANDKKNRLFWKRLENQVKEMENWLQEKAKVKNRSLTEFDPPQQKKNFDLFQRNAKSNPILKAGRLYEDLVDDWFDAAAEQHGLQMVETESGAAIELPEGKSIAGELNPNKLFEVILRYQLQVYLKLSRCFYSRGKEEENEAENNKLKDSNGSAKSTLSLLDRSMAAWKLVLDVLAESEESILEILILLQRLRYHIELEFPQARNFKRPGLDFRE